MALLISQITICSVDEISFLDRRLANRHKLTILLNSTREFDRRKAAPKRRIAPIGGVF